MGGFQTEEQIMKDIFKKSQIIFSTLSITGTSLFSFGKNIFDTVIIDEAAQTVEPSLLIPLQYQCKRLIMVGDPNQLPPVVFSKFSAHQGYSTSLFERMQLNKYPVNLLNVQYRMNQKISNLISDIFYKGKIQTSESVLKRKKNQFEIQFPKSKNLQMFHIDSEEQADGNSYINREEAKFIQYFLEFIFMCKKNMKWENYSDKYSTKITSESLLNELNISIGIISPYLSQTNLLKEMLKPFIDKNIIEIKTVDGFQGREKGK